MSETLRLAGIVNDSITDGPGLRLAVFLQGCPRRCEGCHNPTALSFEGGYECADEEILSMIKKNVLLSGVTLTGGEPFCQAEKLVPLAKKIKEMGLELAIYTGYTFEEVLADEKMAALAVLADVIIDGEFVLEQRDLSQKFKGSKNQRIIDVQESLENKKTTLCISERWN